MAIVQRINPCLWFDDQAEQAVNFYLSVFDNSRILDTNHYGEAGREVHGKEPGSVMAITFELDGQRFSALNGGPLFKFNEAISLQINCHSQEEVDHYWARLGADGDPAAQQCGWLKDRYGLSWQVVPVALLEMLQDPDEARSQRVFGAMMEMKKIEIAALERARNG